MNLPSRRRFPMPPYPSSWYRVADTRDLEPTGLKFLRYFGRPLLATRDDAGNAHVFDGYCPHLGADLSAGASVSSNGIACPFHGWQFDMRGKCVSIPYVDTIPPNALLHEYPAAEVNGSIWMYYDELKRKPVWCIPEIPQYSSNDWTPRGMRTWTVRTHVQEIAENGPDAGHQMAVHGATTRPETEYIPDEYSFRIRYSGHYYADPVNQVGEVVLSGELEQFGLGLFHMDTQVEMPGFVVRHQTRTSSTPVDDECVEIVLTMSTKCLDDLAATGFIHEEAMKMFGGVIEADIPIWENKLYRPLPRHQANAGDPEPAKLCSTEGAIARMRRWAQKFYVEECNI